MLLLAKKLLWASVVFLSGANTASSQSWDAFRVGLGYSMDASGRVLNKELPETNTAVVRTRASNIPESCFRSPGITHIEHEALTPKNSINGAIFFYASRRSPVAITCGETDFALEPSIEVRNESGKWFRLSEFQSNLQMTVTERMLSNFYGMNDDYSVEKLENNTIEVRSGNFMLFRVRANASTFTAGYFSSDVIVHNAIIELMKRGSLTYRDNGLNDDGYYVAAVVLGAFDQDTFFSSFVAAHNTARSISSAHLEIIADTIDGRFSERYGDDYLRKLYEKHVD